MLCVVSTNAYLRHATSRGMACPRRRFAFSAVTDKIVPFGHGRWYARIAWSCGSICGGVPSTTGAVCAQRVKF